MSLRGRRSDNGSVERTWKRGPAGRFTGSVRRRFLRRMATIRRDAVPLFGHLTYSDDLLPISSERHKRNLKVMGDRMRRLFPNSAIVWRTGWAVRKSGARKGEAHPHAHLLIYGTVHIPLEVLAREWAEVSGGDRSQEATEKHIRAGTRLERARSSRSAGAYMAKSYIGKGEAEPAPDTYGRTWGIMGRLKVPWSRLEVREVPWRAFHDARRMIARGARRPLAGAFPWQGVTVFSVAPGSYLRLGVGP